MTNPATDPAPGDTTDRSTGSSTTAPLDGLRVVEGATFVAVPSAGLNLAMLGAEVIRFDPIGGASDHQRAPLAASGSSLYWASLNKGKRSFAVDVRSDVGRELVTELITAPGPDRGVFMTNAIGRGWLSYEQLRERRDDLIMLELTGNPDGSGAVDYTVNYEVGFPTITGPPGAAPVAHALPAWDLLAGVYAATSLLAAERHRSRTGRGERISVSLADVAFAVTDNLGYFAEVQHNGASRERSGDFVFGTFGAPFATADGGSVFIVALTPRQWSDLVEVTGTGAIVDALAGHLDVDFSDEHARYRHRRILHEVLAGWFAARETDAVLSALAETRVLAGRLRTFAEAFESPMVQHNPMFTTVHHAALGELRAAGGPAWFDGAAQRPEPVAPMLGADTEWVLSDILGLDQRRIGELHDQGVVASP